MKHELLPVILIALCTTSADAERNDDAKPWSYDPLTNIRAQFPEQEPNNVCPGQAIVCGDVVMPASIGAPGDVDYYEFIGTAGTLVTIGTDNTGGGDTDTYLELYPANCAAPRLTFDDDGGPGSFSLISNFVLPSTQPYHIKVRHFSTSGTGDYKLFLTCVEPTPPPPNDTCGGALPLEPCSSGNLTGDNTFAIHDYGSTSLPCTGFTAAGKDVVYSVALSAGDTFDVTYTAVADGSVYLITNCADPVGSCVIGADDTLAGQPETWSFVAAASGTYYLILDSFGTNTGSTWTLDYAISCPPQVGACCLPGPLCEPGPCIYTNADDCGAQGGTFQGYDTSCDPSPCGVTIGGACCLADGSCEMLEPSDCDNLGGEYLGHCILCDKVPCVATVGACCFYEEGPCGLLVECQVLSSLDCSVLGGSYVGHGTTCDPSPCAAPPPSGACCLVTGECVCVVAGDCDGSYQGDGTDCDPNPCPPPVATEQRTWGGIKSIYR
ncbi:MAG: PPC domain-containing protein [Candidatus Eisenbacteria bacterium]|nr:PPC domain-containing protein [Candidatus Eisenbacteria bacterium]